MVNKFHWLSTVICCYSSIKDNSQSLFLRFLHNSLSQIRLLNQIQPANKKKNRKNPEGKRKKGIGRFSKILPSFSIYVFFFFDSMTLSPRNITEADHLWQFRGPEREIFIMIIMFIRAIYIYIYVFCSRVLFWGENLVYKQQWLCWSVGFLNQK